jgi:hypothetical protein
MFPDLTISLWLHGKSRIKTGNTSIFFWVVRAIPTYWVNVFMKPFVATVLKKVFQQLVYIVFLFFPTDYPIILVGHISLASSACHLCFPI